MPYSEVQVKYYTASVWSNNNILLKRGEPGYESDTGKLKIGDGFTQWNTLPYFNTGSSGGGGGESTIFQCQFTYKMFMPYEDMTIDGLILPKNLAYSRGNTVIVTSDDDPLTGFEAIIASYSKFTGTTSLRSVTNVRGSYYFEPLFPNKGLVWNMNLSGQRGTRWFAENSRPKETNTQYRVGDFVIDKSTGEVWYRNS